MNALKTTNLPTGAVIVAIAAVVIATVFLASSVSGAGHTLLLTMLYSVTDLIGEFVTWITGLAEQAPA